MNLIRFNIIKDTDSLQVKQLIYLQTPKLAENSIYLLIEIDNIIDKTTLRGTILGTEGFNRGSTKSIFRKIYRGDFAEFDIAGMRTNDTIIFDISNISKTF